MISFFGSFSFSPSPAKFYKWKICSRYSMVMKIGIRTNIFSLHNSPCKTTRYTIKLMLMWGGRWKKKSHIFLKQIFKGLEVFFVLILVAKPVLQTKINIFNCFCMRVLHSKRSPSKIFTQKSIKSHNEGHKQRSQRSQVRNRELIAILKKLQNFFMASSELWIDIHMSSSIT